MSHKDLLSKNYIKSSQVEIRSHTCLRVHVRILFYAEGWTLNFESTRHSGE